MTHPVKLMLISAIGFGLATGPAFAYDAPPGHGKPGHDKVEKAEKAAKGMKAGDDEGAKDRDKDKDKDQDRDRDRDHDRDKAFQAIKDRQKQELKTMLQQHKDALKNPALSGQEKAALKKQQAAEKKAMQKRHQEELKEYKAKKPSE